MDGVKYDSAKLRYDLLPPIALAHVAGVLTFGAQKYAPENWRCVPDLQSRYLAAAFRHIEAHRMGERYDPESKYTHLAHAVTCLMFIIEDQGKDSYANLFGFPTD